MAQNDRTGENSQDSIWKRLVSSDEIVNIEVVTPDKIDAALESLGADTTSEVASFMRGAALTIDQIRMTQSRNELMYARGIRSRTIYLSSVSNDKPTLEHVRWLNERGSEVRTMQTLPLRMIIADKKIAVMPLNIADGMDGLVIYRGASVVTGLQALFELTWNAATPLGLTMPKNGVTLTAEQRALLEQLALGRTYPQLSKSTGQSVRTIGRKVSKLMKLLDAETLFEAAYKAAKRNWI